MEDAPTAFPQARADQNFCLADWCDAADVDAELLRRPVAGRI